MKAYFVFYRTLPQHSGRLWVYCTNAVVACFERFLSLLDVAPVSQEVGIGYYLIEACSYKVVSIF